MTPQTGIRNSLAWLVIAAIVPIIAFSVWMAWTFIGAQGTAAEAELDGTARALMVAVDRELDSQLKDMELLSSSHSLDNGDLDRFADKARRAVNGRPQWLDVVLVDPGTHAIVAGALPIPVPAPTSSAPAAVDRVVATGKPLIVGAFAKGRIIGRPMILLMAPVMRNDVVRFVMTVVLDPAAFNSILNEQHLPPSWTGAVVDADLKIAGRSRSPDLYVGNTVTSLLGNRISAAERGMFEGTNQEGEKVYTVFNRSPTTGWSVALGIPAAELDGPRWHTVMVIAAAGAALVAVALALSIVVGRGIVSRRQSYEAAIRESEERYRLLVEGVSDYAIFYVSPEGLVQSWNATAEGMKGYKAEDIIGRHISCFYPDEDVAAGLPGQLLAEARQSGRCARSGWRVREDGSRFWADVVLTALYDGADAFRGFAKVTRDRTEQMRAEAAQKAGDERMRLFFESQLMGMAITSPEKGWVQVNNRLCQMLGYSKDELAHLTWAELTHPDDLAADQAQFVRLLAGEIDAYSLDKRFIRKDGMVIHTELSVGCVRLQDGAIDYVLAVLADITERKRLEGALLAVTARLKHVLDTTAEGIVGVDDHLQVVLANPAAVKILGWPSAEAILGKSSEDAFGHLLADGSACRSGDCAIRLSVRKGLTQRVSDEFFVNGATGQPIPVEFVVSPLGTEPERGGAVVAFHDITERKALELRLKNINAELEQFAYVASHDMRQPLRMVTSYLSLVEKRLAPATLTDDIRQYLDFAVGGARRMDSLIVGLLEYSRTGRAGVMVPVALAEPVADALLNLTVAIQEAEADVVVIDGLPTVVGDPTELIRLFQNLIGNAVKYRAPGRRPRVEIAWRQKGSEWLLSVADNGIGIASEDCERAFAIFQRLVPKDAYEGTGIGLAVCKKIVEMHGGRIWIESTPGEGSTFFFTLRDGAAKT